MIKTTITVGSRNKTIYILAAAALICAAAFHLPSIPEECLGDPATIFSLFSTPGEYVAALMAAVHLPMLSDCMRNWGLLCIFLLINFHDADRRIIPNRCILAMLLLAVCYQPPWELISHLLSVALTGSLLLLSSGLLHLTRGFLPLPDKLRDFFRLPASQYDTYESGKQRRGYIRNTNIIHLRCRDRGWLKHLRCRDRGRLKHLRFLGGGDVKLLLVLGLYLTPKQTLCMLLLAGLFGLVTALAFFLRSEKNFPFGPGICAAAAISLFLFPR